MEFSAKELARSLPSAEDVIRALGLETHNRSEMVPSMALFGAGLLVGAGLALLFAPTTGRELREEISERAGGLRERAADALGPATATEPGGHAG